MPRARQCSAAGVSVCTATFRDADARGSPANVAVRRVREYDCPRAAVLLPDVQEGIQEFVFADGPPKCEGAFRRWPGELVTQMLLARTARCLLRPERSYTVVISFAFTCFSARLRSRQRSRRSVYLCEQRRQTRGGMGVGDPPPEQCSSWR